MSTPDNPTHEAEPGSRELDLTPTEAEQQAILVRRQADGISYTLVLGRGNEVVIETVQEGYRLRAPQPEDDIVIKTGDRVYVGRESTPDLLLGDNVSRVHCAVVNTGKGLRVNDINSKNGTRIRLPVDAMYELTREPVVKLGEDSERRQQLERKLKEYEERDTSNELPPVRAHEYFKREILRRILQEGELRPWGLARELYEGARDESGLTYDEQAPIYADAFALIKDYVETGGTTPADRT